MTAQPDSPAYRSLLSSPSAGRDEAAAVPARRGRGRSGRGGRDASSSAAWRAGRRRRRPGRRGRRRRREPFPPSRPFPPCRPCRCLCRPPPRLPEPDSVCLQRGRQLPLQIRCRRGRWGRGRKHLFPTWGRKVEKGARGGAGQPPLALLSPPAACKPGRKARGIAFQKDRFQFLHVQLKNASRALSSRVIFFLHRVRLAGEGGRGGARPGLRRP